MVKRCHVPRFLTNMSGETYVAGNATLNTGAKVPLVALGGYDLHDPSAIGESIRVAADVGYRHYDTAKFYKNEQVVGESLRATGIPREQLFVVTKLWNGDHHNVEAGFDESLAKLGLDYIDLYLMHWPHACPDNDPFARDDSISYIETWQAMEKLLETRAGKVKAIGVSNFSIKTLTELLKHAKVVPAMNQVETHPYNQEHELVQFCAEKGIVVSAYSPLGFINSPLLHDEDIVAIANEIGHGVTPAAVILSWNLQRGVVVLPKSVNPDHIQQNFHPVKLSDEHVRRINDIAHDPKRRCRRMCPVYDPRTDKVLGWSYEELGWERP